MSAVKAILFLLRASAAVTAIVPDAKIVVGNLPVGTTLPGVSIKHISTVRIGANDAQASHSLVRSRVQVTSLAKSVAAKETLLEAVRRACNFQRGATDGVLVVSVLFDADGPDIDNDDVSIHEQSTDFMVTWHQPN